MDRSLFLTGRFRFALGAVLLAALLVGSHTYVAAAERPTVIINQIDSSQFPTTTAYVTVLSAKGYPVLGLTSQSFQVLENDLRVQDLQIMTSVDTTESLAAVLVLDVSGSMSGEAIATEKRAANAFVQGMRPQDYASVVAFSTEAHTVQDFTADRGALTYAINGLSVGGNTALYDALFLSVEATTKAQPSRRVVIFMTDGENTRSQANLEDGLALASQLGVPVYTIGLGSGIDPNDLNRIASRTGGNSFFAPKPEALQSVYQTILDQLHSQYVMSYKSPGPRGPRTYNLTVTINLGNERVRSEKSYDATPTPPSITSLTLKDGQTIEGTVAVGANVKASLPITRARLQVNGQVQEEWQSLPSSFSLSTAGLSPGRQEVQVYVMDAAGSEASKRVQVMVPPAAAAAPQPLTRAAESQDEQGSMPSLSLPAVSLPAITMPALSLPSVSLPDFRPFFEEAMSRVNETKEGVKAALAFWKDAAGDAWNSLIRTAQSNTHRIAWVGVLLATSGLGVVGIKRAVNTGQILRLTTCPACGRRYRSYELECPACLAQNETVSIEEERSLGEVLVQNNLLTPETLSEMMAISREQMKSLEVVLLERSLVSLVELSRARFYLDQSTEMHDRLSERSLLRVPTRTSLIGVLPRFLPSLVLVASAIAAWSGVPFFWR